MLETDHYIFKGGEGEAVGQFFLSEFVCDDDNIFAFLRHARIYRNKLVRFSQLPNNVRIIASVLKHYAKRGLTQNKSK